MDSQFMGEAIAAAINSRVFPPYIIEILYRAEHFSQPGC